MIDTITNNKNKTKYLFFYSWQMLLKINDEFLVLFSTVVYTSLIIEVSRTIQTLLTN